LIAHASIGDGPGVTLGSEEKHDTRTAGGATGDASVGRKGMYAMLLLVAASIVASRILTAPQAFTVNDQSRWSTVRALVDTGSYSIGRREMKRDGSSRDVGIIAQPGWDTADKVLHPKTRRFYSSKPTLLSTVAAGKYWLLRHGFDLSMDQDRITLARIILLTINWLPFVLYLLLLARLVERLGTTEWGRLFVFATACFGTFVSGFLASLNNHSVAATGALFALYQCLCIHLDDDRRSWRFLLAGLSAGWTMCNELPAASLAAGIMLWLLYLSPARTIRLALPALLLPLAAALYTQYLAVGTIVPTYARESWYRFEGSYWNHPIGIDRADEPKLLYAFNLLVGHTGILSLTPVLWLGWIGMIRTARSAEGLPGEQSARRIVALLTLSLTVVTFVFYVLRTHNYGGIAAGPRWFIWLVPLWLLTMLPEVDRWGQDRRRRRVASVLLAFSVVTATYALANPWQHPLLFAWFEHLGWISYQ